ncbi:YbjN domain-containing protein [Chloroflexia bacterium SDU3-3]|nr:YbjN domain-containing protein [Chloroflexia bacterium SDU3-3]
MISRSQAAFHLHNKLERYLQQKNVDYTIDKDGDIVLQQGSTQVFVRAVDWSESQTVVRLFSPISLQITRFSSEIGQRILEENYKLLFGKFSLDTNNKTIWFEHALLGDYIDPEEFISAIVAIAMTADEYDEMISNMVGGKRAIDL